MRRPSPLLVHVYTLIAREHSDIREQGSQPYPWHHVGLQEKERRRQSEGCQSRRNVDGKGMAHSRTLRMCAQKPLHDGGDALYAKDQSAAIRQRAEAEYLYAGRATSFSRYYESPRAEETLSSESQLVWAQMQDRVHASHFVGRRFTSFISRMFRNDPDLYYSQICTRWKYFSVINK